MKSVVSVIVPVYNGESTIGRTLRSLAAQTLSDIEIIVIDDASTDRTLALCQDAQRMDSRIKIVHSESNRSPLQARRIGVTYANGNYVMFCDADDELLPEAVEQAAAFARGGNYDLVHFNVSIVSSTGSKHEAWERSLEPFASELSGDQILATSPFGVDGTKINGTVCNKLYGRRLLKWAWAPIPPSLHLIRAEDVLQTLLVLRRAKRYGGLPIPLYRYNFGAGRSGRVANRESFQYFLESSRAYRAVVSRVNSHEWTDPAGFDSGQMLRRLQNQLVENQLNYFLRLPAPADAALNDLLHHWPRTVIKRIAAEQFPDKFPYFMETLERLGGSRL